MLEDRYFLDEGHYVVTAAMAGISKNRWCHIYDKDITDSNFEQIMKNNRFDCLPITGSKNDISEYFITSKSGEFEIIKRQKVRYNELIKHDLPIEDLVSYFNKSEKHFAFIEFNGRIAGLVTPSNLNCKQVQIYLFTLICDIERKLSDLIETRIKETNILNHLKDFCATNRYEKITRDFNSTKTKGLDERITEFLFFKEIIQLIKHFKLYSELDYSSQEWSEKSSINHLRNKVAHPTRSLINKNYSINTLDTNILKMRELIFRLNNWSSKNQSIYR